MTAETPAHSPPRLVLFRGWDEKGRHVWSPFVVKLEARLRLAGLKYETDIGSPKTAPKGKIPYINVTSGDSGVKEQFSDSALIIENLIEAGILPALNNNLSATERSHDVALRALLEDKLYFYHTRERWIDNYYTMRDYALWSAPYPVRVVVGLVIYRKTQAMLHGQGTGRFTAEEIANFRLRIWQSINELLVESRSRQTSERGTGESMPFWALGGQEPTEADCTLFGFIVSVLTSTAGPDSRKLVQSFPAVLDYADRIQTRYFPDYDAIV